MYFFLANSNKRLQVYPTYYKEMHEVGYAMCKLIIHLLIHVLDKSMEWLGSITSYWNCGTVSLQLSVFSIFSKDAG